MDDILLAMAVLTPIVVACVEGAKRLLVPDRWAPIVAVGCGVGLAFLFPPSAAWNNEVASGFLAGLAASGLYSGTRAVVAKT